jgi:hypothetical protein
MGTRTETKKLKVGAWVLIHWDDIFSNDDEGWVEAHKTKVDVAECTTAGIVVKINRRRVVLAMSAGGKIMDKQVGTFTAIPLGCINKVEVWP